MTSSPNSPRTPIVPFVEDTSTSEDPGDSSDTTATSTLTDEHHPDVKAIASSSEDGEQNPVQDTLQSSTSTAQTSPKSPSELQGRDDEEDNTDKRGNPAACIFVASLTKAKTDEELNISVSKHFAQWGALLNVKVLKDWLCRPYAFVQYERVLSAKKALKEAPGTIIDGRSIRCEPARVNRTICISPFAYPGYPLSEKDLNDEMSSFGAVEDVFIVRQEYCAYIRYCYRDDAIRAFLSLRSQHNAPRWLVSWAANISTAIKKPSYQMRTDPHTVFVGNLSMDVSEDDMYERFSEYGNIDSVKLIRRTAHKRGHSQRMFAFVKFDTNSSAQEAVMEQNGIEWHGRQLRVSAREFREQIPDDKTPSHPPVRCAVIHKGSDHPHPPGMGFPASDMRPTTTTVITRPLLLHQGCEANDDVPEDDKDEPSDNAILPRSHTAAYGVKKDERRAVSNPPPHSHQQKPSHTISEERHIPIQTKMASMNPVTTDLGFQEEREMNGSSNSSLFVPPGIGSYYEYGPLPTAASGGGVYPHLGYYPPQASPQHALGPLSAYPVFSHRHLQERVASSYMNGGAYYVSPYSMYSPMPYTTGVHYAAHTHFATGQPTSVGPNCRSDLSNLKGACVEKGGRKHKKVVRS